jgi:hypothetical protein
VVLPEVGIGSCCPSATGTVAFLQHRSPIRNGPYVYPVD